MNLYERLRNNLGLKLLSLGVAVIVWAFVQNEMDPISTRRVTVPIEAINVPDELAVVSIDPQRLTVTLTGRESAFDRLSDENFQFSADMSGRQAGPQTVLLAPRNLPPGIEVRRMSRTAARIELDLVISASRPVQVESRGRPADGFAARNWTVNPNEVTIKGPGSVVQRVLRVVAVVDISGYSETYESTVKLEARDQANLKVTDVAIEPALCKVTIPIQGVETKTIPVVPVLGSPAEGYAVASVSVYPAAVTVSGSRAALGAITSVQTTVVDISSLRGENSYSTSLRVPEGITVLGSSAVRVTVRVRQGEGYAGGRQAAPTEQPSQPPQPTQPAQPAQPGQPSQQPGTRPAQPPTDTTPDPARPPRPPTPPTEREEGGSAGERPTRPPADEAAADNPRRPRTTRPAPANEQ